MESFVKVFASQEHEGDGVKDAPWLPGQIGIRFS
ncbi:hypothetical protein I656_03295 [Geobacillus sp. WSUCF1]|nr:hypothetical protein I656_03295 [Geobacillus sp. WSUCF1]